MVHCCATLCVGVQQSIPTEYASPQPTFNWYSEARVAAAKTMQVPVQRIQLWTHKPFSELAKYPFLINQEKLTTDAFRAVGPHRTTLMRANSPKQMAQAISKFQLHDKEMPFS
ncbi:hypothetical protein LAZ67_21001157 [Cordylochernes scorpioides]|uniref:Uncharacterized protein n=1 Tax=Cordylochernes scorpioides TaxID=51811 RepID=A0ABY6LPA0_9ARAC|nr:hypothetical protein LAZ67_21001157 [Cordylochernes scorpioides]